MRKGKLIEAYQELHTNPKRFIGTSTGRYIKPIRYCIETWGAETLLDYGSGKGSQYLVKRAHERWGGILPTCYDPGYAPFARRPTVKFDGVICTDVMEHVPREEVPATIKDIFGFAKKFAFFAIATTPSRKTFPDGTNVHVTIEPPEWWSEQLEANCRGLPFLAVYDV